MLSRVSFVWSATETSYEVVEANQGTGFRQGICPKTCSDIFNACKDSLFYFNHGSSRAQLSVCRKDSLICSKLAHIARNYEHACELLGLNINSKVARDQEFLLKVQKHIRVSEEEIRENSICHDLTSSNQLYGRSPVKHHTDLSEEGGIRAIKILSLISTLVVFLVV